MLGGDGVGRTVDRASQRLSGLFCLGLLPGPRAVETGRRALCVWEIFHGVHGLWTIGNRGWQGTNRLIPQGHQPCGQGIGWTPHLPLRGQCPISVILPAARASGGREAATQSVTYSRGAVVCRVACISLRAMGGQDQLRPSGKQCLSPQAVDTLPHLTPGGPSSHFRVSLGLRLTPAEPCSPAETLQPGHSVPGEGGLQGSPLAVNKRWVFLSGCKDADENPRILSHRGG